MDARTRDPDTPPPPTPPRPVPGGPPRGRGGRDLTQGPITRTLLIFSLPLLGGNALQSLNGTVNQIWVSHTLGEIAITALGNANIVMMLMMAAVFGVSMAANILIAQFMGARDPDMVRRVMGTTTTFFVGLSLLIALFGGALSPALLDMMGTPPEARAEAIIYLRIIFASVPFQTWTTRMFSAESANLLKLMMRSAVFGFARNTSSSIAVARFTFSTGVS